MMVNISVDLEDLAREIPASKIVKAYGASRILGTFTMREIISALDTDSLLETIGEEKIQDFLNHSSKQKSIA